MTAVPELSLPAADVPVLTVVPAPGGEAEAWDFGKVPVQGELFPRDYATE
jgi:hypothetical protein